MLPEKAPIVEINCTNVDQLWPCLLLAVRSSTFVALDAEFSGIGCRKRLQAKNIEERYKSISEVSQSRSVLSLGLSCFKYRGEREPDKGNEDKVFLVQTFNILTLCSDNYLVEPSCLRFLVEHGFDFNKLYSVGVKYSRGIKDEDLFKKENQRASRKNQGDFRPYMRLLTEELISGGIPIVLHNALIDLIFLYGNFYCHLPEDLATFVSDLSSMFKGGIFDTKVIAEYKMRMQASFLEYVYKKSLKENKKLARQEKSSVIVEFLKYPNGVEKHLAWVDLSSPSEESGAEEGLQVLCWSFSNHGWCIDGVHCKNSHDVDLVIKNENNPMSKTKKKKKQKQKQKQKEPGRDEADENPTKKSKRDEEEFKHLPPKEERETNGLPEVPVSSNGTHRAGFDAFMTGLAFSVFLTKYCKEPPQSDSNFKSDPEAETLGWGLSGWGVIPGDFGNKIYLSGKDFPLQISQSSFSKPSKSNLEKLERLGRKV